MIYHVTGSCSDEQGSYETEVFAGTVSIKHERHTIPIFTLSEVIISTNYKIYYSAGAMVYEIKKQLAIFYSIQYLYVCHVQLVSGHLDATEKFVGGQQYVQDVKVWSYYQWSLNHPLKCAHY